MPKLRNGKYFAVLHDYQNVTKTNHIPVLNVVYGIFYSLQSKIDRFADQLV